MRNRAIFKSILPFILGSFFAISFKVVGQDSLFNRGDELFVNAAYDEAFEAYQSASLYFDSTRDYHMYALANIQMSFCLSRMSAYQESLILSENTLSYVREFLTESPFLEAEALRAEGDALLNIGRNDEALKVLLTAEKLYPPETEIELAEALNLLGVIYWNNANTDLAIQYHNKALNIRKSKLGEHSLQVGDSYNNIGLVYADGEPVQAGLYFNRALKIYEENLGSAHPKVAFCLINLARSLGGQGRISEATQVITRVNDIWSSIYPDPHPSKSFTTSTLGQIYANDGNYERSLHYQEVALKEYISLFGKKHPEVANTYFLIGELHMELGNYKDAAESYQEAIFANLLDQETQHFRVSPRLEDYFNADYLLSALLGKAKALEVLHVEYSLKPADLKAAVETYLLADSLTREIRKVRFTEKDKIRLGEISRSIYDNGIHLALSLAEQPFQYDRYADLAFEFCERSKSSVLLEAIQETKAKSFSGIPEDLIVLEDSLKEQIAYYQQQVSKGERIDENQAQLFKYQQAHRDFVRKLEIEYPRYHDLKYQTVHFQASDLRQSLDDYQALLSYFIGKDNIYIFLVTKQKIEVITRERDPFFLQNVSGLRNAIKFKISSTLDFASSSLYDLLIPEIPEQITELVIIPDGLLNTIPYEVLRNPDNQQYLIEKYGVSYDYSAGLMMQRRKSMEYSEQNQSIMLVAPIEFENEATLYDLPASAEELKNIDFLFSTNGWQVQSRVRQEATESRIKSSELTNYRYLHFATHGLVNESQPELSQLFLSPDSDNDGYLYSGEIYNLRVNAELVCLSACETGLGKIEKGEGIVGLSRALLYAGAQNLMVSLWQVADQSTAELMVEFYRQHLFFDHVSDFNLALREAKKALISSEKFSDPYYWAPFILVGQ